MAIQRLGGREFLHEAARLAARHDARGINDLRSSAAVSAHADERGATIYSYGMALARIPFHGPLAELRIALIDANRRSVTTSKHQTWLFGGLGSEGLLPVRIDTTTGNLENVEHDPHWAQRIAAALAAEWRHRGPGYGDTREDLPLLRFRRRCASASPETCNAVLVALDAEAPTFPPEWENLK